MTVLVLGGTAEGRALAAELAARHVPAVTSLAGDVADLRLPAGEVRVGGFGGVAGLVAYLRERGIVAVVDATHPFAARITANAAAACAQTGVPLLRLSRPGWSSRPDAVGWHWVDDLAEARRVAGDLGSRVFLSTGRQEVADFLDWPGYVLLRAVDPPAEPVPPSWEVLCRRGPFTLADELALLNDHAIDVLVTKDSGGTATAAKLDAAAQLGVPVIAVRRPGDPPGVAVRTTVDHACGWLQRTLGDRVHLPR